MIISIADSRTKQFIEGGKSKFSGLNVDLAYQRLAELNAAPSLEALGRLKSVGLHRLEGSLRQYWSININGRWRIHFLFKDGNAYEVRITDPH